MTQSQPPAGEGTGVQGAAARLSQDTAALVREELRRGQAELLAAVRRAGLGAGALAGAGLCGLLALASAHQTALRSLENVLPRARAAGVLTLGYTAGGAALAWCGVAKVRAAGRDTQQAMDRVRA